MKRICLIIGFILIASCSKESDSHEYEIDLVNKPKELLNYWVLPFRNWPIYPKEAIDNPITGCVKLSFIISSKGITENVKVLWSEPSTLFNKSAKKTVEKYNFKPTKINKNRVKVKTDTLIKFDIKGIDMPKKCEI